MAVLTGLIGVAAWFLLFSGVFRPSSIFSVALPQANRKNDTIPLRVTLPDGDSSEGLLWQDLSILTPSNDYLLHSR